MCELQKSKLKGPCKRNVTELTMASFVGSVSNQSELTGLAWLFVESSLLLAVGWGRWMRASQLHQSKPTLCHEARGWSSRLPTNLVLKEAHSSAENALILFSHLIFFPHAFWITAGILFPSVFNSWLETYKSGSSPLQGWGSSVECCSEQGPWKISCGSHFKSTHAE